MNRREFLYGLNASLGSIALTSMLGPSAQASGGPAPHFPAAKARRCIFLYMEGGPSHIDNFDPKPKLAKLHLQEFHRSGERQSAMSSGKRYYVQSPFAFRRAGHSGADLNTLWENLAGMADRICFYRGLQVESVNHPTANYHVNTGNRTGGDPALGAWVQHGLGRENEDLPNFIVLPELSFPQGGPVNWSNGFLPTRLQGTALRASGSPLLDLRPPAGVTRRQQRRNLDLLQALNERHATQRPQQQQLAARMRNYELAFRMQMQVPKIVDLETETRQTQKLYGIGEKAGSSSVELGGAPPGIEMRQASFDYGANKLLRRKSLEPQPYRDGLPSAAAPPPEPKRCKPKPAWGELAALSRCAAFASR